MFKSYGEAYFRVMFFILLVLGNRQPLKLFTLVLATVLMFDLTKFLK